MLLIKNRKGFSLTELLIVVAILGVVSPLLFYVLVFGLEDYSTTTKYLDQQYTVMEVSRHIRQDFEEAKKVILYKNAANEVEKVEFQFADMPASPAAIAREEKIWKFESGSLQLDVGDTGTFSVVKDNLDIDNSYFLLDSTYERFILSIRPKELNDKKYRGRNVNENVITEFSVRYKNLEVVDVP